ncbi:MAG: 4-phosphopantetheinyl transferase family protein [Sphingobacteriia bacterium]|nr:MAG: 4-phosphopantetheinyl transferase family protein [Sphingobacteriia bacterium]
MTTRVDKVKHKFLDPSELAEWRIEVLQDREQMKTLTLLWSCKEAIFKWWGRGDIDFSKSMLIRANALSQEGLLEARFLKGDIETKLSLNYQLKNGLSLVWVFKET